MNEFERNLYTRGLENLYGSVLLDDAKALEQIERLVRLTRALGPQSTTPRSLEELLRCIADFFLICWPDQKLEIRVQEKSGKVWLPGRGLAEQICLQLTELEKQHVLPDLLTVTVREKQLSCSLLRGEQILWQGETAYA